MNKGLNLVLLGKIGAGKSASGNTILGRQAFESKESFTLVTQDVAVESGTVCGFPVTVYDTPGLFNTRLSEEEIQQMVNEEVFQKCESELFVFLLVIRADRFTEIERITVEKIEELLGETRLKKTWILFTGGDELEEENVTIKKFIDDNEALKKFVQKYDQRYHVFNNMKRGHTTQVTELLTKIYRHTTFTDIIEKGAKPKVIKTREKPKRTPAVSLSSFHSLLGQTDVGKSAAGNPILGQKCLPVKGKRPLFWEPLMRPYAVPAEMFDIPSFSDTEIDTDIAELSEWIPAILKASDEPDTLKRLVLLGGTGVGKSAAGNTILGKKVFKSERTMNSVTCESTEKHTIVSGRSVSVVDTPGFFHTNMNPEELMIKIARSVYSSSPGPHAFLIVLRVDVRFTEMEQQIRQKIEMLFGEEVFKYSIILFTHGDLIDEPIETVIEENYVLRDLVDQCGGRYHIFNNKDLNNRFQVNDLLQKIDSVIEQNGGGHYSNQMYEDAHRFRREEEKRRRREEEERKQQEEKQRQEEIERVIKETEERIRSEFDGPPRFLQERLKQLRQREEDMIQQEEKRQEEIEREMRDMPHHHNSLFMKIHLLQMHHMKMHRKQQEEIERAIKETEDRVRAEIEAYRSELERLKAERQRQEYERQWR